MCLALGQSAVAPELPTAPQAVESMHESAVESIRESAVGIIQESAVNGGGGGGDIGSTGATVSTTDDKKEYEKGSRYDICATVYTLLVP